MSTQSADNDARCACGHRVTDHDGFGCLIAHECPCEVAYGGAPDPYARVIPPGKG